VGDGLHGHDKGHGSADEHSLLERLFEKVRVMFDRGDAECFAAIEHDDETGCHWQGIPYSLEASDRMYQCT